MARIIDLICAGKCTPPDWVAPPWPAEQVVEHLSRIPAIFADNVVQYMMESAIPWINTDYPNIMPPFPSMWIESCPHTQINVNGTMQPVQFQPDFKGWGSFINCVDVADEHPWAKWLITMTLYQRYGHTVIGPCASSRIYINADGTWPIEPVNETHLVDFHVNKATIKHLGEDGVTKFVERFMNEVDQFHRALLWAIAFMHCKNVKRVITEPIPALSRKWAKRHGKPLVRGYTLDIDPMREVLRKEGNSVTTGIRQALHICRGHFKTYTPEKPLLGKHVGTYWWPSLVRGHAEEGVIAKDYNVKAPKHD